MNTDAKQGAFKGQSRSLKIERKGNAYRGRITPGIRLHGQWLEKAGFLPGHRVEIQIEQPGTLTLRFLEQSNEVEL